MGLFLRFILPSLSRRCLAHLIGTHSPRLHFCREPNLASSRREPLLPLPGQCCSFGEQSLEVNVRQLRWISRSSRGSSLPSPLFTHTEQPWGWYILVKGNINIPCNLIRQMRESNSYLGLTSSACKPLHYTYLWCQRVESNHWPLPYEGSVLTDWTTRAYVISASCVDSSHASMS